jgi:hypothetical protein
MIRPLRPAQLVLLLAVVAAVAGAWPRAGAAPARERPGAWREHLSAGRAALGAGDLVTARIELTALDSVVGGHAGAMYALAQIAAQQGERDEALRWLRASVPNGIVRRVAEDSSFAALRGDKEFESLAERLAGNGTPVSRAKLVARLTDPAMLPEDVVYDAPRRRYLVSSIHWRKIVSVSTSGIVEDFIRAPSDDVWGMYGLALDAPRGRLWATTLANRTAAGFAEADSGRSALLAFSVTDGRLLQRIELPRDGAPHEFGDVCTGPDGAVYVSDSRAGIVYRVAPGGTTMEKLSSVLVSPQKPVVAADGRRLLVADYARGIAAITLRTGEVTWLPKPRTLAAGGVDGLQLSGRTLIAIQNGTTPRRVIALELDAAQTRITGWRVLEQASEQLGEPTHGVIVGRDLVFIGNSGWDRVNAREELETPIGAPSPVLLRLEKVVPAR